MGSCRPLASDWDSPTELCALFLQTRNSGFLSKYPLSRAAVTVTHFRGKAAKTGNFLQIFSFCQTPPAFRSPPAARPPSGARPLPWPPEPRAVRFARPCALLLLLRVSRRVHSCRPCEGGSGRWRPHSVSSAGSSLCRVLPLQPLPRGAACPLETRPKPACPSPPQCHRKARRGCLLILQLPLLGFRCSTVSHDHTSSRS